MIDDNDDEFQWDYSYFAWQNIPRHVRRQMVRAASQFGRTWIYGRTYVVADIFKRDILGVTVVSSKNHETKAMGAAYLAGLDLGYFKSTGEISSQRKSGETFIPRSQDRRESLRSG